MSIRHARKFKEQNSFDVKQGEEYYLLPFRFHRLNKLKEILVNEVGDFLIVPVNTVAEIVSKKISKTTNAELYGDLIAGFFISEQQVPTLLDIISTRYRTKKAFLEGFTSLHIFVITLRCEHTCHYCQVSRVTQNKSDFDMDRKFIDAGIDLMMHSPNPNITMEFQGGEALLAFDNIIYAIERTKKEAIEKGKKITYVICTNLAPLTENMLLYCRENGVLLSTSLDGPDFVHNRNRHRPGNNSYELAITGIERAKNILGEENISALLTTTNLSLQHPIEIVDEYFKLGFKGIFLRPISPYGFANHNEGKNKYQTEQFLDFYKKALNRILKYNLDGNFYREEYATIILKKIITPFPVGYVDLQSPAGMINSVIVFNYDGKIYASDEARMLAENKDFTFLLGTLGESSYQEIFYGPKALQLSESWINESLPGCSECAFQSYCGTDPVLNHATQLDIFGYRPTSTFCHRNMEIIRHLIELMDSDKRIENIFISWTQD